MTDATRYPAHVFWSDEDEGYIAVARDLPGCSAFGETQQEALTELQAAIVAWTEAAHAAGNPIPEPSQPAVEDNYSGKVLLRMPKSLHAKIANEARTEGVSLNQQIVILLTSSMTQRSHERQRYNYLASKLSGVFNPWNVFFNTHIQNTTKVLLIAESVRFEKGIGSITKQLPIITKVEGISHGGSKYI